jgi:hypothetical protein
VRFWAFLGKGSSKNPQQVFLQKVHVENFLQKKRPKKTVFLSTCFVYRAFVFFSAMGVQKHHKKRVITPKTKSVTPVVGG